MSENLDWLTLIVVVVIGIFLLFFRYKEKTDPVLQNITEQRLSSIETILIGVKEFTVRLDSSPQYRGSVGEDIVSTLLAELPIGTVQEQLNHTEIPGRPDFVVSLPNITELLVIDAKMTYPDGEMHDNKFRSILVKRAEEITKYIVPGVTFDFVLMWIPDGAYYKIDNTVAKKLYTIGVVPVTTPTMLGVVHLLQRAHRVFRLNELTSEFVDFHGKIQTEFKLVQKSYDKARTQLKNAFTNFELMAQTLFKLSNSIDSFEENIEDE